MIQKTSTIQYLVPLFFWLFIVVSCAGPDKQSSDGNHFDDIVYGTIIDVDNNEYKTIIVGNQEWFAENLRVAHFSDGTPIPHKQSDYEWEMTGQNRVGAYSVYPRIGLNEDTLDNPMLMKYGKLYNWHAIENTKGICPQGWSVPSEDQWVNLIRYAERDNTAGDMLKSNHGWDNKGNGLNLIGFNVLPGGYRGENGKFHNIGSYAAFWSATPSGTETAKGIRVDSDRTSFGRGIGDRSLGFSVRCIRNLD